MWAIVLACPHSGTKAKKAHEETEEQMSEFKVANALRTITAIAGRIILVGGGACASRGCYKVGVGWR
jgi:hypothetical protein